MLPVHGTVLADSGVAGSSFEHRNIVGIDVDTGERKWQTPAATQLEGNPSIAGETAIMGTRSGVLAVELGTGTPLWSAGPTGANATPVLVDDLVFVADTLGYVYALR